MYRSGLLMTVFLVVFGLSNAFAGMGVKAGFSFSNQDVVYTSGFKNDFERHNGFEFILFKHQPLTSLFRYTMGVGYAERGLSDQYVVVDETGPDRILGSKEEGGFIKYIILPVMLEVSVPAGGIKPYLAAGPRLMVKIGTTYDVDYAPFFGDVKTFVFGATYAVGGELNVAPKVDLFLEIAYSPDFSYAIDVDSFRAKSDAVTLLGGFRF